MKYINPLSGLKEAFKVCPPLVVLPTLFCFLAILSPYLLIIPVVQWWAIGVLWNE